MSGIDLYNNLQNYQIKNQDYDSAFKDLQNALNSVQVALTPASSSIATTSTLQTYPGKSFTGQSILQVSSASDISSCEQLCLNSDECTGGTFTMTSTGGNCSLASGQGNLVDANRSQTATGNFMTAFVKDTTQMATIFDQKEANLRASENNILQLIQSNDVSGANSNEMLLALIDENVKTRSKNRLEIDELKKQWDTTHQDYSTSYTEVQSMHTRYYLWLGVGILFAIVAACSIYFLLTRGDSEPSSAGTFAAAPTASSPSSSFFSSSPSPSPPAASAAQNNPNSANFSSGSGDLSKMMAKLG